MWQRDVAASMVRAVGGTTGAQEWGVQMCIATRSKGGKQCQWAKAHQGMWASAGECGGVRGQDANREERSAVQEEGAGKQTPPRGVSHTERRAVGKRATCRRRAGGSTRGGGLQRGRPAWAAATALGSGSLHVAHVRLVHARRVGAQRPAAQHGEAPEGEEPVAAGVEEGRRGEAALDGVADIGREAAGARIEG